MHLNQFWIVQLGTFRRRKKGHRTAARAVIIGLRSQAIGDERATLRS